MSIRKIWFFLAPAILLFAACTGNARKPVLVLTHDLADKELTDSMKAAVKNVYGYTAYFVKTDSLPGSLKSEYRPRYRADKILQYLKQTGPDSVRHILLFTSHDISVTKYENGKIKEPESRYRDFGVFGYGSVGGRVAVVSNFRLRHKDRALYLERVQKVFLHELGHNLGLNHCPNKGCLMMDAAEKIATVDGVRMDICGECRSRVD